MLFSTADIIAAVGEASAVAAEPVGDRLGAEPDSAGVDGAGGAAATAAAGAKNAPGRRRVDEGADEMGDDVATARLTGIADVCF